MLKKCVIVAVLAVVLAPASARADWLFTPHIGATFGGSTGGNEHFTYGASIGWMGAGILGWEAELGYTPEFFRPNDDTFRLIDDANVTSVMFNVLLGAPVGGTTGGGFRPYFTGGLGLLSRQVESVDALFDVSSTDWGFNLGGGAMGFMTDHVGFRGDLRYIRSFSDVEEGFVFEPGSFDFWRATAGVTFRW